MTRSSPRRSFASRLAPAVASSLLAVSLGGCALLPWNGKQSGLDLKKKIDLSSQSVDTLYNHGLDALHEGRYSVAIGQFDAIQQNYPYSPWATHAELLEGYAEYRENHYASAVAQLDRYIQLHPQNSDTAYAYYLRALSYFEQIEDVQRDQKSTVDALAALQEVVNRYPGTAYARDASLKIDLCRDHLAGKEMEIGRYYEQQHEYEAAINRYQAVINDFQTTNHVPEALARLTSLYLRLGLVQNATRTASVLAYNYPGSSWYQTTWNRLVDDRLVNGHQVTTAEAAPRGFFGRTFGWMF